MVDRSNTRSHTHTHTDTLVAPVIESHKRGAQDEKDEVRRTRGMRLMHRQRTQLASG